MVPLGQPGQFSFDGPDSMESPPRSDENTSEGADSGPVGNTDCPAAGTALAATDAAGENTSACATPTGSQQIEPTAKVSPAPEAQPAAKPRPRGKRDQCQAAARLGGGEGLPQCLTCFAFLSPPLSSFYHTHTT